VKSIGGMATLPNSVEQFVEAVDVRIGLGLRWYVAPNVVGNRGGRLRARAASCSKGDVLDENLYGTELLSSGWT